MYQLVYVSTATRKMTDDDLLTILDKARQKNAGLDVTGILLYRDGRFMQVLEGNKDTVKQLYGTIVQDDRHKEVKTLLEGNITAREFGEWAMGYPDINKAAPEDLEGVSQYMEGKFTREELQARQSKVQAMLKIFKGLT